jgi:hypothetical protein
MFGNGSLGNNQDCKITTKFLGLFLGRSYKNKNSHKVIVSDKKKGRRRKKQLRISHFNKSSLE